MSPKADSIEIAIQNALAAMGADPTLKGTDATKQHNAISLVNGSKAGLTFILYKGRLQPKAPGSLKPCSLGLPYDATLRWHVY
jgi:hypothetical protein